MFRPSFPPFLTKSGVLVAFTLCAALPAAHAQTTFNTLPGNGHFDMSGSFLFGQTITAPNDNILRRFQVQLENEGAISLFVYAYDPVTRRIPNTPLFSTPPTAAGTVAGESGYDFKNIDLSLTTGQTYALLFMKHMFLSHRGNLVIGPPDAYPGGQMLYGFELYLPFTPEDDVTGGPTDLAFILDFSPAIAQVPEPGSLATLAAASVLSLVWRRRRVRS
jgi:hypothetical protein